MLPLPQNTTTTSTGLLYDREIQLKELDISALIQEEVSRETNNNTAQQQAHQRKFYPPTPTTTANSKHSLTPI